MMDHHKYLSRRTIWNSSRPITAGKTSPGKNAINRNLLLKNRLREIRLGARLGSDRLVGFVRS